mmetsp:Transcript_3090/g.18989  ORF Transcript_3090/g.18989 Transcript_3090/m.18989 type:complete len:356 (-) Transcript_3090:9426-10493(-)
MRKRAVMAQHRHFVWRTLWHPHRSNILRSIKNSILPRCQNDQGIRRQTHCSRMVRRRVEGVQHHPEWRRKKKEQRLPDVHKSALGRRLHRSCRRPLQSCVKVLSTANPAAPDLLLLPLPRRRRKLMQPMDRTTRWIPHGDVSLPRLVVVAGSIPRHWMVLFHLHLLLPLQAGSGRSTTFASILPRHVQPHNAVRDVAPAPNRGGSLRLPSEYSSGIHEVDGRGAHSHCTKVVVGATSACVLARLGIDTARASKVKSSIHDRAVRGVPSRRTGAVETSKWKPRWKARERTRRTRAARRKDRKDGVRLERRRIRQPHHEVDAGQRTLRKKEAKGRIRHPNAHSEPRERRPLKERVSS